MCMYICIYPSASYIHTISISISISIPISTYQPSVPQSSYLHQQKKTSSSLYRSPFLIILPRPARACAYVCIYIELMEGFSSLSCPVRTSPRPSAPLPPKKKKETLNRSLRFGGFPPSPLPHVMVHHTYSHN